MARLSGALIAVLLVLAACGARPTSQAESSVSAAGSSPAPAESVVSPSLSPSAATPADVLEEQQFKLEDVAQFDDGLVIDIAGTVAEKASRTDRGAEATNGEIVIASVRIENNTKKPYDAKSVLIGAKYGGENQDAQIIVDKTDELQSGFKGKIKPKDESIATIGFAVPWKELTKVTFIVDPNDDVHEVISFTGRVHRA
jgi:hypothetical protein